MKLYIYIYIYGKRLYFKSVGLKDLAKPNPFHIRPKAHVEEEEMLEDEQRKSRLLGYTAEDDLVLGRPKSQKGKAPRC